MKFLLVALLFVVGMLTSNVCALDLPATPTTNGSTGLVRLPSADVIPHRNFNVGIDYGQNQRTNDTHVLYKVNLGTYKGVELGVVGGSDPKTSQFREGVFINMKYSLSTEDIPNPLRLAIGVENLASAKQTDVYMVATKYMSSGLVLTFGFMGDFPGDRFRPLGVAGLALPFGVNQIILVGDILVGESLFQVDAGIRLALTREFSLMVNGVNIAVNPDQPNFKDPKSITFGISWLNPFI